MSRNEVDAFLAYLDQRARPEQVDGPLDVAQGGEMSIEQYEEMVALMKADAEQHGKARPVG